MSKDNMKDKFKNNLDDYFNGVETEESEELLEIIKALESKDFSEDSNKEEVFNETLKNINKYKGEKNMRKSNKSRYITKVASVALVGLLSISLMQTSFAQEVVGKVLKTISLGHIVVFEDEFVEMDSYPVPDGLKGKVFDKDGNPIIEFSTENSQDIYTADGEKIDYLIDSLDVETGKVITIAGSEEQWEEDSLIVKNPDELNNYTCFDVIIPSYLPEGYKFEKAEFYKDENGIVENSKYISLYFTNEEPGKYIYMQQRFADKETAYATGGTNVEEVKINGADGVIYSDKNLDWEANGIIYGLSGRGEADKDELIKIAESIK